MPLTLDAPSQKTDPSQRLSRPWLLVVYDDPVNLMSFVVMVFEKVFEMPLVEAEKKMWEIHSMGKSVVWSGALEPAEMYLQQLHLYGLQAKIEKAESDD